MVNAHQKRWAVNLAEQKGFSQRRACEVLKVARSTVRYQLKQASKDAAWLARVKDAALDYPRFGYRRIAVMLSTPEQPVNPKRIYRLWQQAKLSLPKRKRHYRRRQLAKRLPVVAMFANHVWSYDIIHDRLANGRMVKCLCIVDEYTRECLRIDVQPSMTAKRVIGVLRECFERYGEPKYLRSDNGSQFTAKSTLIWLQRCYTDTLFIEPGKPWQNGYVESFHARLRDECLNLHYFQSGFEAQLEIEHWRQFYNTQRPHSALNDLAPEVFAKPLRGSILLEQSVAA